METEARSGLVTAEKSCSEWVNRRVQGTGAVSGWEPAVGCSDIIHSVRRRRRLVAAPAGTKGLVDTSPGSAESAGSLAALDTAPSARGLAVADLELRLVGSGCDIAAEASSHAVAVPRLVALVPGPPELSVSPVGAGDTTHAQTVS